jgi:hypothetical protein
VLHDNLTFQISVKKVLLVLSGMTQIVQNSLEYGEFLI